MKTATTIYRWTAKTSSRCLGRYYTASTLPEAIKAGKEFVTREFHGKGDIVRRIDTGKMRVHDDHIPFGKLVTVLKDETDDDRGNILVGTRETTQAVKFYEVKLFLKKVND